jgi:hypothetical protein
VAAHLGSSRTELARNSPAPMSAFHIVGQVLFQGPEMGALPTLRAATDPGASGSDYYGADRLGQLRGHPTLVQSELSHDEELQRRLWAASERLTGVVYTV